MSIVASLTALLKLDTQGFSTGVNAAIKSVSKLNRKLTFASRDIQSAGTNITALSAPFAFFGVQAVKAAARAEEQANIIRVVFRDMQKDAGASIRQFADDFDLANTEATKLIATTGNLLTGFGFTQKEALKLSDEINRLAGDLTSFDPQVTDVADASERLTKGILGQTKALIGLKIAIRQDTKEFKNLVQQTMQTRGLSLQAAKAVVIFNEALKQSQNAIGDYARTSGSFVNTLRRISQRFIDLRIEVGKFLIEGLELGPVLIKVADGFTKVINFIRGLSPELKKLISRILLGVTVMGPLLLVLGSIGLAVSGLVSGVVALASSIAALISPMGLAIAAVAGLGAALVKVFDVDLKKAALTALGFVVNLKTNFQILATFLKELFTNVWENFPMIVRTVWDNIVTNSKVAVEKLGAVLGALGGFISSNWDRILHNMLAAIADFAINALNSFIKFTIKLGNLFFEFLDMLERGELPGKDFGKKFMDGFFAGALSAKPGKKLSDTINDALNETSGFVSLTKGLEGLVPQFPGFITSLTNSIEDLKNTVGSGPGGGPGAGGALAQATGGTVAELTKGTVEAFRIRANAQLKPAEETAKNTSETVDKLDTMIDVGVPIRGVRSFDILPA